jgi:hypothetical protein
VSDWVETQSDAQGAQRAPVRGTQSFVGVMSAVWKRPSLTGLSLLWRWSVGIPTVVVCAWEGLRISHAVAINTAALSAMTVFKPVEAGATVSGAVRALMPVVLPVLLWLLPAALGVRTIAAAVGRAALLRRLDAKARRRRGVLFVLSVLRVVALLVALAVWCGGVVWANRLAITGPAGRGSEPDVVLLCALVIFGTLGLFLLWASVIWIVDAAIVIAAERGGGIIASVREGLRARRLRSKLIEIDLVMGIVKIGLIVLAMVFSACPLPFESVESQTFLAWWWVGVGVLYFVASDYFHVVRMAAYLELYRRYEPAAEELPRVAETAS